MPRNESAEKMSFDAKDNAKITRARATHEAFRFCSGGPYTFILRDLAASPSAEFIAQGGVICVICVT